VEKPSWPFPLRSIAGNAEGFPDRHRRVRRRLVSVTVAAVLLTTALAFPPLLHALMLTRRVGERGGAAGDTRLRVDAPSPRGPGLAIAGGDRAFPHPPSNTYRGKALLAFSTQVDRGKRQGFPGSTPPRPAAAGECDGGGGPSDDRLGLPATPSRSDADEAGGGTRRSRRRYAASSGRTITLWLWPSDRRRRRSVSPPAEQYVPRKKPSWPFSASSIAAHQGIIRRSWSQSIAAACQASQDGPL
jgi:hypothetical protein